MTFTDFKPGDKVMMETNTRQMLGFVEHAEANYVRVRWEDGKIGQLVFDWQIQRLQKGWPYAVADV